MKVVIAFVLAGCSCLAQESLDLFEKKRWKSRSLEITKAFAIAGVLNRATSNGKTWEFKDYGMNPLGRSIISVGYGDALRFTFDKDTRQTESFRNEELGIETVTTVGSVVRRDKEEIAVVKRYAEKVLEALNVRKANGYSILSNVMYYERKEEGSYWRVECLRVHSPENYSYENEGISLVFDEQLQLASYDADHLSHPEIPEEPISKARGEKISAEGIAKLPKFVQKHFQDGRLECEESRLAIVKPNNLLEIESIANIEQEKESRLCWVVVYKWVGKLGEESANRADIYVDAANGDLLGGEFEW